jgi:predicted amidophosphoribosyltransferase
MKRDCQVCGSLRSEFDHVCGQCGTPVAGYEVLQLRCAACETPIPKESQFCLACGMPVTATAPPSAANSAATQPVQPASDEASTS